MVKRGAPQTRTYADTPPTTKEFTNYHGNKIQFTYRPNSSDDSVMNEILVTHWYRRKHLGFDVEAGEHWLDLGANIGVFGLLCWFKDATCTAYEPQEDNYKILLKNMKAMYGKHHDTHHAAVTHLRTKTVPFFRGRSPADFARYSTDKTIYALDYQVPNVYVGTLDKARMWDGIKMDIEAAEHPILDNKLLPRCKKLAFEYHIRKHPNMADFRRRMTYLRSRFRVVHYAPSLDKGYPGDEYPGAFDRMIFCMDPK